MFTILLLLTVCFDYLFESEKEYKVGWVESQGQLLENGKELS